jgi:hypothetical protein
MDRVITHSKIEILLRAACFEREHHKIILWMVYKKGEAVT